MRSWRWGITGCDLGGFSELGQLSSPDRGRAPRDQGCPIVLSVCARRQARVGGFWDMRVDSGFQDL